MITKNRDLVSKDCKETIKSFVLGGTTAMLLAVGGIVIADRLSRIDRATNADSEENKREKMFKEIAEDYDLKDNVELKDLLKENSII